MSNPGWADGSRHLWPTVIVALLAGNPVAAGAQLASQIIKDTRITTGLAVHVGSGDGALACALAAEENLLAHGIENDAGLLQKAREKAWKNKVSSRTAFATSPPDRLPYDDSIANVVIVDDLPRRLKEGLALEEIWRVVAPLGVAYVGQGVSAGGGLTSDKLQSRLRKAGISDFRIVNNNGLFALARKPWPEGMDEWSHPRYGPDGNAVSKDKLAGIPSGLRWIGGPFFLMRGAVDALVSSRGRVFAKCMNSSRQWYLIARDGFNGVLLWTERISSAPMVAAGDRVYAAPAKADFNLAALDGKTGRILQSFKGVTPYRAILHLGDRIVVGERKAVKCVDATSGGILWTREGEYDPVLSCDGSVFLQKRRGKEIECLHLADGAPSWRTSIEGRIVSCHRGLMTTGGGNGMTVLDARTGKVRWHHPYHGPYHHAESRYLSNNFFIKDLIWIWKSTQKDGKNPLFWVGLDPETGEERRRIPAPTHPRCSLENASERFIYFGSADAVDLEAGKSREFRHFRPGCVVQVTPANGVLYSVPARCVCFPMIRGFMGYRTKSGPPGKEVRETTPRLEEGPAEASTGSTSGPAKEDWPTYRYNGARGSWTPATVSPKLEELWSVDLTVAPTSDIVRAWVKERNNPLTAPVVLRDLVVVAMPQDKRVAALSLATGALQWSHTAGGVIDTPPTLHGRLVLFGCRDGWVYCLNADSGALVWRYRTAPKRRLIVGFDQVESEWPVVGGVLIHDGLAYACTGRHPLIEEGVTVSALEPESGRLVWESRLDRDRLKYTVRPGAYMWGEGVSARSFYGGPPLRGRSEMALAQYLATDGTTVGMSQWGFDPRSGNLTSSKLSWRKDPAIVVQDEFRAFPKYLARHTNRYYQSLAIGHMVASRGATEIRAVMDKQGITLGCTGASPWKRSWGDGGFLRGLVGAGPVLFVATEERSSRAGRLTSVSAAGGTTLSVVRLEVAPVFDGLAAARGRLLISTQDGSLACYGEKK